MLTFLDSIKLAYTKLRIRRIRLFFTILTASLLFGVLVALSLIVTGALRSVDEFSKDGFNNRYILRGEFIGAADGYRVPEEVIAYAKQYDKDREKKRVETAKELGLDINSVPENEPSFLTRGDGKEDLNQSSPGALWAVQQYHKSNPPKDDKKLFENQVSRTAEADFTFYQQRMQDWGSQHVLNSIVDGKEDTETAKPQYIGGGDGVEGIKTGWSLMSKDLMTPFVLDGQSLEMGEDGSVPIIIPFNVAEKVLTLSSLAPDADPSEKRQRIEAVRQQIGGKTFSVCYRNGASVQKLSEAMTTQKIIDQNKNNKDYQKPKLIYTPSDVACAAPVLESDTRTDEEKKYVDTIAKYNKIMGRDEPPVQKILTFRIVGVTPKVSSAMNDVSSLMTNILNPTGIGIGGFPWASPYEIANDVPLTKEIFFTDGARDLLFRGGMRDIYYAEAKNAASARDAIRRSCSVDYRESGYQVDCEQKDDRYIFGSFGSASLAIDQFKEGFNRFQLIVAGVIAVVAGFIIMGIIGRIIADSRKETAIFRAVGASRLMIAQIYSTYGMFIVAYTIAAAVVLGFVAAMVVDRMYAQSVGLQMAIIYNVKDLSMPFRFYGIDMLSIGVIIGAITLTVFVGMLFPILANVRRRPITDMRDE